MQVEEKESVKVMLVAGTYPGWGGMEGNRGLPAKEPKWAVLGIPQTPASYVLYPTCTMRLRIQWTIAGRGQWGPSTQELGLTDLSPKPAAYMP